VTALSASAIGSELLEMMKRTLGRPVKVIEPPMSPKKENSGEGRRGVFCFMARILLSHSDDDKNPCRTFSICNLKFTIR
jgi:hypothetical protein